MALLEYRITKNGYELYDKVKVAIERIKAFEPAEGYWLAYGGGKDSVVCKALCDMAGVKYQAHYSCTSVDPPELVRFIKSQPDVCFDIPKDKDGKPITMWNLIPRKLIPPTRYTRYCCEELKESAGKGYITITGVRWAESANRKNNQALINIGNSKRNKILLNFDDDEARRMTEQCYRTRRTMLNPIIDWLDEDVWEFIKGYGISYCILYDCGYKRLGCIGCPLSSNAKTELEAYPKYKENYIRAFYKMLNERRQKGLPVYETWKTGEDVMDWWLGKNKDEDEDQILIDFDSLEKAKEYIKESEDTK